MDEPSAITWLSAVAQALAAIEHARDAIDAVPGAAQAGASAEVNRALEALASAHRLSASDTNDAIAEADRARDLAESATQLAMRARSG